MLQVHLGSRCQGRWGVLLLCRSCCFFQTEAPSSVVVSVHINYLSYIEYGPITAFSILLRWLARLTDLTSKVTRMVYSMGGLAPPAKICPCAVPCAELLLLSPYRLAAFKSITFLLPVFVSS